MFVADINDVLATVEGEIVDRVGAAIVPFFETQVRAGEQHLATATPPGPGDRAPDFFAITHELTSSGRGHWSEKTVATASFDRTIKFWDLGEFAALRE